MVRAVSDDPQFGYGARDRPVWTVRDRVAEATRPLVRAMGCCTADRVALGGAMVAEAAPAALPHHIYSVLDPGKLSPTGGSAQQRPVTRPLAGTDRFIQVRGTADRLYTASSTRSSRLRPRRRVWHGRPWPGPEHAVGHIECRQPEPSRSDDFRGELASV